MAGPFVILRDSSGAAQLAWGDAGLNAQARALGFDVLVLTANGIQDPSGTLERRIGVQVLRCGYEDNGDLAQAQRAVERCAPLVADLLADGKRVLLTCAAGENRSALLTARALHLLTGEAGATIVPRMMALRPRRPPDDAGAFSNNVFRRWALTWPEGSGRQTAAWKKAAVVVGGMIAGAMLVRLLMV